jgi:hypothetical protein
MSAVQGRVVTNYPLSAAYTVRVPKHTTLPLRSVERLLNRERVALGRDKGFTWWLSGTWTPDPLFSEGRQFAILRQVFEDGDWVLEHVGICRILPLEARS